MKKVNRDFDEAFKTYEEDGGWTVVGDTPTIALQAMWQTMECVDKLDEIINYINNQNNNCSPLTCPFNLEITQLFNRIEKLENDMKLCKEHYKKILEGRG